ncbi:unnamed protein product [Oppiella nova]|uniref:Uncharacterized protein n=1 Tax=Oppiella nova TaxID=334625 RepID=A0A7R9QWE9_9ACAR|nr:unnamed protein product [Oppiella nova]CAG2176815.1 unnamed protein product [Oppiella nova]
MDIDRLYRIMGAMIKRVYGYYITRPLQRFNVDNRAEKAIDRQHVVPKAAPRHERTDQLFTEITQKNPRFKQELNEKREDLLKRLTSVKVISTDRAVSEEELKEMKEIKERVRSRLPVSHEGTDIPMHAYVEPASVPKGRISLIRALDFIGKHSKSPEQYDSGTIAKQHALNEEDVRNVLTYFKPFYKEGITDPVEDTESLLGVSKQKWSEITTFLKPKSRVIHEQINAQKETAADEPIADKAVNPRK